MGGNAKWYTTLENWTICQFLTKLNILLPQDDTISFLGILPANIPAPTSVTVHLPFSGQQSWSLWDPVIEPALALRPTRILQAATSWPGTTK